MRVVKCKGPTDDFGPLFVYCGRGCAGYSTSPLANPYHIGRDGDRATVIAKYRVWLWRQLQENDPTVRYALADLTNESVLGCWCVNTDNAEDCYDCHCGTIARCFAYLKQQQATTDE